MYISVHFLSIISCHAAVKPPVMRAKDEHPKSQRLNQKAMVINKLATHVPDLVLARSQTTRLPSSQKFEGVLMFADISGKNFFLKEFLTIVQYL